MRRRREGFYRRTRPRQALARPIRRAGIDTPTLSNDPINFVDPYGLYESSTDYGLPPDFGGGTTLSSICLAQVQSEYQEYLAEMGLMEAPSPFGGSGYGAAQNACMQLVGYAPAQAGPTTQTTPPCWDWTCMPAAFSRAVQALTLDPDCMALFGSANSRANGWNPVNVLTDVIYGSNSHGSVVFKNLGPGDAGVTTPSGFFGLKGLIAGKVTITINEYTDPSAAYWNAGYSTINAELLLHELAHAYTLLHGSGGFNGTRFISDAHLDSLIQTNCFPGGTN